MVALTEYSPLTRIWVRTAGMPLTAAQTVPVFATRTVSVGAGCVART